MRRLKVLIADDHRLMLKAMRMSLEEADDLEIVGEATSGSQVLPLVAQANPDLVLLDIRMPGMDGLMALELIRNRYPKVKVVMISGLDEPDVIKAALRRGAAAFIAKELWLAEQTVKFHLTNIYRKLGVANRTEAVRYAYRHGLVESPLLEQAT